MTLENGMIGIYTHHGIAVDLYFLSWVLELARLKMKAI